MNDPDDRRSTVDCYVPVSWGDPNAEENSMSSAAERRARRRYMRMLVRLSLRAQCPRSHAWTFRRDYVRHVSRGDCRKATKEKRS